MSLWLRGVPLSPEEEEEEGAPPFAAPPDPAPVVAKAPNPIAEQIAKLRRRLLEEGGDVNPMELAAAQVADARQGAFDRASDAIYSAFTGRPYQQIDRGPGQMEGLRQRQALTDSGRDRDAGKLKALEGLEANEPTGPGADLRRSFYRRYFPDLAAQIDGATPAQLDSAFPYLKEGLEMDAKRGAATAKGEADAREHDPSHPQAKSDRETLLRLFPDMEHLVEGKSAAQLKELRKAREAWERQKLISTDRGQAAQADRDFRKSMAESQHAFQAQQAAAQRAAAAEARAAAQGDAAELRRSLAHEKEGERLMKATPTEVAALEQKLKQVVGLVGNFDETNKAAIAGLTPGEARLQAAGAFGQWFMSDKGKDVWQTASGIVSTLLMMQSGKTVTEQEVGRKLNELGLRTDAGPQQFRRGLANLRGEIAATLRQIQSGYDPSVVETYKKRGGVTPDRIESIGQGAAPAPAEPLPKKGDTKKLKSGKTAIFDGMKWVLP